MSGTIPKRARSSSKRLAVSRALQWIARCIVLVVVLAAPWFFGGVTSGICYWLFLGVGIALLVTLASRLLDRANIGPIPLIAIPLGLAIGFAFLQIVPLPVGVARLLSPTAVELRSELTRSIQQLPPPATDRPALSTNLNQDGSIGVLGMSPSAQSATDLTSQSLSLYPSATQGDLVLLTLGITVFALGYILFASRSASRFLLVAVALNGLVLACVGLVQEVASEPGRILWFELDARSPFATFVNQNHAGGYLNLCLACAAGMLTWAWRRAGSHDSNRLLAMPQRRPSLSDSLADTISRLNGNILLSLTVIAFLVAGIVCSLSRGAFVGMCVATLVATLVYRTRRGEHRALLGAVAIAAGIGLVAWFGLGDIVTDRLATLLDREAMAEHGLLEHWAVTAKVFPDYWLAGSGLGTYGYIYGPYLDGPIGPWFIRAENQYLEALIDGGIIGFLLLAISLVLAWIATITLVRRANRTADIALATAGIFAIGSQTITAAFDFGLYAPANLILLAILCGPVVRRAIALTHPIRTLTWIRLPAWRFVPALASIVLLVALGYCYLDIRAASLAESAQLATNWDRPIEVLEVDELEQGIDGLTQIAKIRPGDVNVQLQLAELWTNLYRLRAIAILQSEAPADIDRSVLWNLTSPVILHRQLHDLAADKNPDSVEALAALRTEPTVTRYLGPAYRHLQLARAACPLLPRIHLRLAELCGLDTDPNRDRVHIARACKIAPGDPDIWFQAGVLDAQAGRNENAFLAWRRCLELSDQHINIVLRVAEPILDDTQLVNWLLPAKPELLLHLARTRYANLADTPNSIHSRLLARAADLILNASNTPNSDSDLDSPTRAHLLGAIYAEQGKMDEALAHYRTATDLRPFELEWQYEYAKFLIEAGHLDEALDLARRCIRLAPKNRRYKQLLERIRTLQLST